MTERRKTVGEEAVKRLTNPDTKQGIIDTQREVHKGYFDEVSNCIDNHPDWTAPFYIVVHTKKERTLDNVIRNYFIARQSLPSPQWDETVWRYSPSSGDLRFVWVLPDEGTAQRMANDPHLVEPECRELLGFVMSFLDKKLYRYYHNLFHKGERERKDLSDSPYAAIVDRASKDYKLKLNEQAEAKPKIIT